MSSPAPLRLRVKIHDFSTKTQLLCSRVLAPFRTAVSKKREWGDGYSCWFDVNNDNNTAFSSVSGLIEDIIKKLQLELIISTASINSSSVSRSSCLDSSLFWVEYDGFPLIPTTTNLHSLFKDRDLIKLHYCPPHEPQPSASSSSCEEEEQALMEPTPSLSPVVQSSNMQLDSSSSSSDSESDSSSSSEESEGDEVIHQKQPPTTCTTTTTTATATEDSSNSNDLFNLLETKKRQLMLQSMSPAAVPSTTATVISSSSFSTTTSLPVSKLSPAYLSMGRHKRKVVVSMLKKKSMQSHVRFGNNDEEPSAELISNDAEAAPEGADDKEVEIQQQKPLVRAVFTEAYLYDDFNNNNNKNRKKRKRNQATASNANNSTNFHSKNDLTSPPPSTNNGYNIHHHHYTGDDQDAAIYKNYYDNIMGKSPKQPQQSSSLSPLQDLPATPPSSTSSSLISTSAPPPPTRNYESLPMVGILGPSVGSMIAFRELELTQECLPQLSDWKVKKISSREDQLSSILICHL